MWRWLVAFAAAPVIGVGLHFLQVVWALGWAEAWADCLGISYVRGGVSGLATRWEYMKLVPEFLMREGEAMFFWPFHALVLAGTVCLLLAGRERRGDWARRSAPLFWALLLASPTWFLAMPYAAVRNVYTIQQLLPLAFAVMGVVIMITVRALFARGTPGVERGLAVIVGALIVFGQGYTLWGNAQGQSHPIAAFAEALGPDALPPRVGVLSNAVSVPFAYYLRRPCWQVPNMERVPPVPFPESLAVLQKHLPPDWPIQYYLYASWGDSSPFELLASTCPGRTYVFGPGAVVVLFDISALHRPPEQRTPLDPDVKTRQLRGEFPVWDIPGIQDRMRRLADRMGPK